MKLDEWDWWQKQEALEKLGLDKCPVKLNMINKETTVERKFQRFEQFLKERADFEKNWRGRNNV